MSARVPNGIVQLHSSQYRNAQSLPDGAVLVVGTGQSGAQIAEDLQLAGRAVHLCVGSAPRVARRYRGKDVVEWLEALGHYDLPVDKHPLKEGVRGRPNHYVTGRDGGRDIDLRAFARDGMSLYGRLRTVEQGKMSFAPDLRRNLDEADRVYNGINALIDRHIEAKGIEAPPASVYQPVWTPETESSSLDLAAAGVSAIVWSTGFTPDWSYVQLPLFDGTGYPVHRRGVTAVSGVYVVGLPWLWTWGSGRFLSVGRDAEFLVQSELARRVGLGAAA
jgi:putative flavoprotein involved in K+ transport